MGARRSPATHKKIAEESMLSTAILKFSAAQGR